MSFEEQNINFNIIKFIVFFDYLGFMSLVQEIFIYGYEELLLCCALDFFCVYSSSRPAVHPELIIFCFVKGNIEVNIVVHVVINCLSAIC